MLSKQYKREYDSEDYDGLKKTYSIWLIPQSTNEMDGCIRKYNVEEHLFTGVKKEEAKAYDKICIVEVYVGSNHSYKEKYEKYDELLTPISILLTNKIKDLQEKKKILKEEYGFHYSLDTERSLDHMCNLSLNLIEEGRIEGREEGRKEGKAEERIEGIKKIVRSIKNIMENLSFTFEQAIQALGIPEEEVEEYRMALYQEE